MLTEPCIIWLTGLSGAGKTTLSRAIAEELRAMGVKLEVLDGDQLRELFGDNGFTREARHRHALRTAHLAAMLERNGITVIVALISPYRESRSAARTLGKRFFEVFVDAPLSLCEKRDPKGLYARARAGEIHSFTGIDDPYEAPESADLRIDSQALTPTEATAKVVEMLLERSK